ncbi:peptidoglycan hydrolase [Desmospora sp. 8437]|uniref:LysM domain-containing protein n=2 Tax=Kroppenstedtia eburnea TaxID=714067 RepID=A0A1N7P662_9BACL|nr:peptidoglycan hydrolase [Desmospora sp. 8437]SIT06061.1 LysM domain-containing protein [Kroppenstedtia eburnea]
MNEWETVDGRRRFFFSLSDAILSGNTAPQAVADSFGRTGKTYFRKEINIYENHHPIPCQKTRFPISVMEVDPCCRTGTIKKKWRSLMVYHPDKKVMTSLTLAGSLLLGAQSAQAAAVPEQDAKTASHVNKGRESVQKVPSVQQAPRKMEYHVLSSVIRMHMGADPGTSGTEQIDSEGSTGFYVVKKGDTLSKIAAKHHMNLKALLKKNPQVRNPDRIYVGDRIRVSGSVKASVDTSSSASVQESREGKEKTTLSGESQARGHWQGTADAVIREARAHLDATYQYGAEGPDRFDCSGFTRYVFKRNGYDLPRTSSSQAAYGSAVSRANLRKGDLVFFRTGGGGISHVAIYMGDGKLIHATNPRNDVTINGLSEPYWSERYAGARRVIQ